MRAVEPQVFLLAETVLPDDGALPAYLQEIGAEEFRDSWVAPSDAEALVEVAGRVCYRAFKPGLNPIVTKVREGNGLYLKNLLAQHHGSVLEHASVSFLFLHVSRVFTHELVRHRVGVGISQESLRYVRLADLSFWMPAAFRDDPDRDRRARVLKRNTEILEALEEHQRYLAQEYALDETGDFEYKKRITSAMRRFAPLGLATAILWTANFRTLRWVIEERTAPAAEEEIRLVFDRVAGICSARYRNVFQDFQRDEATGAWTPGAHKV